MSAWTNTLVKCKFLPKNIVEDICDDAIKNITNIWYNSKTRSFENILNEWLDLHKEDYDYFVNECDISKDHMTEEYLMQDLKNKREHADILVNELFKVKNGEITLEKFIRQHKYWREYDRPRCRYINNTIWVAMPYEIFRYRHYSNFWITDKECPKTVDDLLKYLENGVQDSIYDFSDDDLSIGKGLTEKLRNRIIKYYSQFGDGNFAVYFG